MQLPSDQISSKTQVGELGNCPVYLLSFLGGLQVVAAACDGSSKVIAAGPHRAIAKHLAKKRRPDIKWTELAKSDEPPLETYERFLPRWEAVSDQLAKAEQQKDRHEFLARSPKGPIPKCKWCGEYFEHANHTKEPVEETWETKARRDRGGPKEYRKSEMDVLRRVRDTYGTHGLKKFAEAVREKLQQKRA